jgi:phosphoglucosamine mutase
MRKLFGTDGIRGNADTVLTDVLVRDIGRAVAVWAREGAAAPRIVVGRDTRTSGPRVEQAFVDGATAAGADVLLGGVLPTAAVAYLMNLLDCDVGIVISASHNPPQDNGIKVFGPGGWKLSVGAEADLEAMVGAVDDASAAGTSSELPEALDAYIAHLDAVATHDLRGLRAVVDCANGAASPVAKEALERIGVEVTMLNDSTDGARINDHCGALHPDVVAREAAKHGAIGITFDGDADRVLLADERGRLMDGDAILAILARELKDEGRLRNDAIVATVMANQALRRWCDEQAIKLVETPVGDRHVLEGMRDRDLVLGGEQSGHVIRLDRATTGDGILAAIGVLDAMAATRKSLADLIPFEPFPQVLVNVRTPRRDEAASDADVLAAVQGAEARLGSDGRVLVRPSGTEPLVRVMVEAPDERLASAVASDVADAVCAALEGTTGDARSAAPSEEQGTR